MSALSPFALRILALLESGPQPQARLKRELSATFLELNSALMSLSRHGAIKFKGSVQDAGLDGRRHSPMWGLPAAKPYPALYYGVRVVCPACHSSQVYRTKKGMMECHTCNDRFGEHDLAFAKPAPKPKTPSGSGIIAGRIVIGRGAKWGAGLV